MIKTTKAIAITAGVLVLIGAVVISIAIASFILTPLLIGLGVYFVIRMLMVETEDLPKNEE